MARRRKRQSGTRSRPSAVPAGAEGSLEQLIPEKEFVRLFAEQAQPMFRLSNFLLSARPDSWGENHMFLLLTEANAVESMLDDFDARNNKAFSYLTELIASARGFANAAHALHHLKRRLPKYDVDASSGDFRRDLTNAVEWTGASTAKLLAEIHREAELRSIPLPREAVGERSLPSAFARLRLPRTADEEDVADETQRIAEVASKYLKTCDIVENIGIERIEDPVRLRHFVARSCTEEKARMYETSVHNLQSKYDTYIKNTAVEAKDPQLKRLRGFISVCLHLLEYVTHLVHFYERHENDIRYEPTKQRIARIIVKTEVLDMAVNFGLYSATTFLNRGRTIAQAIFPAYTRMREETLEVPGDVDLHLRPATLISKVANHFGTPVQMKIGQSDWIDVASTIKVVLTIGMNADARKVVFRGDENALRDLRLLFECGLGEGDGGLERLPERLAYLR